MVLFGAAVWTSSAMAQDASNTTVMPETATVRPAVATVRASASGTVGWRCSSSRNRLTMNSP